MCRAGVREGLGSRNSVGGLGITAEGRGQTFSG